MFEPIMLILGGLVLLGCMLWTVRPPRKDHIFYI